MSIKPFHTRKARNDLIFLFGLKIWNTSSFITLSYENIHSKIDREIVLNEEFKIGPESLLVCEKLSSYTCQSYESKHILKTQKIGFTINDDNFRDQSNASNSFIFVQRAEVIFLFGFKICEYLAYYYTKGEVKEPMDESFIVVKPIILYDWVIYKKVIIYLTVKPGSDRLRL